MSDNPMMMSGRELPVYLIEKMHSLDEQPVASGMVDNRQPCILSIVKHNGDHLLVATVGGKRAAISGMQLIGCAASLQEVARE
ncbi:MAG: hypothetical protein OEZ16_07085 [Chromatiales bacterium]|nr:hypothetical protein [Chromatiales bacterium]